MTADASVRSRTSDRGRACDTAVLWKRGLHHDPPPPSPDRCPPTRTAALLSPVLALALALAGCGQRSGPPAFPASPTSSNDPRFLRLAAHDMSEYLGLTGQFVYLGLTGQFVYLGLTGQFVYLGLTGQFVPEDPRSVHAHRIPRRGCLGEADGAIHGTYPQNRTDPDRRRSLRAADRLRPHRARHRRTHSASARHPASGDVGGPAPLERRRAPHGRRDPGRPLVRVGLTRPRCCRGAPAPRVTRSRGPHTAWPIT